jgi:O-antigen chain-terminating methyltransferase
MIALLDETLRVLKPGGLAIFETPNPQNILVGACNFYLDPTHRHPLPPALLEFIFESRGFERVKIEPCNPYNTEFLANDESEVASRFNELFYGPQDYAVVAYKSEVQIGFSEERKR